MKGLQISVSLKNFMNSFIGILNLKFLCALLEENPEFSIKLNIIFIRAYMVKALIMLFL